MSVRETGAAIRQRQPGEVADLAEWFERYQAYRWDQQIEADALAGRLDGPAAEAAREFGAGRRRLLRD